MNDNRPHLNMRPMVFHPDRPRLDDVDDDIQEMLYDGDKVEAIRQLRARSEMNLKEARYKADEIERRLEQLGRDHLPPQEGKSGCMSLVLIFAAMVLVVMVV